MSSFLMTSHFEDLTKKVMKILSLWQNKLLSFGERYNPITYVMPSILIYLLSAMDPLCALLINFIIFFKIFYGKMPWGLRINAGYLGRISVILGRKEEFILDSFILFSQFLVPSYGGILKPLHPFYGVSFCLINTVRSTILLWKEYLELHIFRRS